MSELPESIAIFLPNGVKYEQPTGLFINNKFVPSIKKKTIDSLNPATGKINATIYTATAEDVNVAVDAARNAFKNGWRNYNSLERSKLIINFANLLEENKDLIAAVEAYDSGKPVTTNSVYDIEDVISVFRYFGGWADKIEGKTVPIDENHFSYTIHEPHGVCAQIIPWNYPLDMLAWKIAPAIATGNTVVLKTSELTPLSALFFAKFVVKAGFPPGVINILTGTGQDVGKVLATHPNVDKVAFTGSTKVGQMIQGYAAVNLNSVSLETGGKSPAIIFEDADIEKAIKWTTFGIFFNSGQVCSATSRILVQDSVYDKFVEELGEYTKKNYKNGDPFKDHIHTDVNIIGPQISKLQKDKILGLIDIGKKEGAKVVCGGKIPAEFKEGYYVEPTVFADVTKDMTVFQEEIFGPVVTVSKFSTQEEAIELANGTEYGLAAAVFTQNLKRAHTMARDLESGTVWINASNEVIPQMPFGGVKKSGVGRELGEYGLQLYTEVKGVTVNFE